MSPVVPFPVPTGSLRLASCPPAESWILRSSTPKISMFCTVNPTISVPQNPVLVSPAFQSGCRRRTVVELASTTCAVATGAQTVSASASAAARLTGRFSGDGCAVRCRSSCCNRSSLGSWSVRLLSAARLFLLARVRRGVRRRDVVDLGHGQHCVGAVAHHAALHRRSARREEGVLLGVVRRLRRVVAGDAGPSRRVLPGGVRALPGHRAGLAVAAGGAVGAGGVGALGEIPGSTAGCC